MKLKIGNILISLTFILQSLAQLYMQQSKTLDTYNTQSNLFFFWGISLLLLLIGLYCIKISYTSFIEIHPQIQNKLAIISLLHFTSMILFAIIQFNIVQNNLFIITNITLCIIAVVLTLKTKPSKS